MSNPPDSRPPEVSHYSRLFGGPFASHDEGDLGGLAAQMKDIPENRRGRRRQGDLAPSAFVYLGQFLAHDLTRDETRLEHAGDERPDKTRNRNAPRLNLESVYGGGPNTSQQLYDHSQKAAETFLVGRTNALPEKRIPSTRDDFLRVNGEAVMADTRNDQHLIIAQLHVVFLKFHNRIVDLLKRGELSEQSQPNETIFETAQRLSIWHYQWIIRNEFLRWFMLPQVLIDIQRNGPRLFKPNGAIPALPVEFTQAAFRFGHSTVQPQYEVNRWIGLVRLRDLVRRNLPGENGERLSGDRVIDWDGFTRTWGGNANFAENIDTLISKDLFNLPAAAMPVPFKTSPPPLPEITLMRGSRIGLPSGQEACRTAGISLIAAEKIGFDGEANKFLQRRGLHERTPLWFYLLREAELLGIRRFHGGECLGPLGSRIVAEVLLGVLKADPNSYFNVDANWKPLVAVFGATQEPRQLDTLRKFIAFSQERESL